MSRTKRGHHHTRKSGRVRCAFMRELREWPRYKAARNRKGVDEPQPLTQKLELP